MRGQVRAWVPVAAWVALIAIATSVPLPARVWPAAGYPLDWLGHFLLYFGLGWLVGRALWTSDRWSVANLVVAALVAVLFAVADEWHQRWMPTRVPSLSDWLADVSGLSLGLALFVWARWRTWRRVSDQRPPVPDETVNLALHATDESQ